jgi:hypothetical protein
MRGVWLGRAAWEFGEYKADQRSMRCDSFKRGQNGEMTVDATIKNRMNLDISFHSPTRASLSQGHPSAKRPEDNNHKMIYAKHCDDRGGPSVSVVELPVGSRCRGYDEDTVECVTCSSLRLLLTPRILLLSRLLWPLHLLWVLRMA